MVQKGTQEALQSAWEAAGKPALDKDGGAPPGTDPEETDIPLEAEEDDVIELDDDDESLEGAPPEGGTAATSADIEWPEDLPETYFGKDIKAYASDHGLEAAKTYHSALVDATKDYNRRLEEFAAERKRSEPDDRQPPSPDEPSKDDIASILSDMGVNVNNTYAEEIMEDVLEPIARALYETRQQVDSQTSSAQEQAFERDFFNGLSEVETEYGEKLPLERQQIIDLAVGQDVYSPRALYLSVMGPVWKALAGTEGESAKKAKTKADEVVKTAKKQASRQKGRRSASPDAAQPKAKPRSIEEAAKMAARQLGRSVVRFEK